MKYYIQLVKMDILADERKWVFTYLAAGDEQPDSGLLLRRDGRESARRRRRATRRHMSEDHVW